MRIKSQYLFVIAVVVVLVLAFTVGTVANRAGKSGKAEAKTGLTEKRSRPGISRSPSYGCFQ